MKLLYFAAASITMLSMAYFIPATNNANTNRTHYIVNDAYDQSVNMDRDIISVIYLPNNVCHINTHEAIPQSNYKDYVRVCLNNRHSRRQVGLPAPSLR